MPSIRESASSSCGRCASAIDPHAIYASGARARVEFLYWRWTDALRSFDLALETAVEGTGLLERTEQLIGKSRSMIFLAELALGYARVGRDADASRLTGEIRRIGARRPIGAGCAAMAAAAVGDYDEMVRWLEIAAAKVRNHDVDEGFIALNNLRMNITADPALEQPRVRDALDRIRGD